MGLWAALVCGIGGLERPTPSGAHRHLIEIDAGAPHRAAAVRVGAHHSTWLIRLGSNLDSPINFYGGAHSAIQPAHPAATRLGCLKGRNSRARQLLIQRTVRRHSLLFGPGQYALEWPASSAIEYYKHHRLFSRFFLSRSVSTRRHATHPPTVILQDNNDPTTYTLSLCLSPLEISIVDFQLGN